MEYPKNGVENKTVSFHHSQVGLNDKLRFFMQNQKGDESQVFWISRNFRYTPSLEIRS
jgi:hypothetical protein